MTRIGFVYAFDDVDWLGGKNYFASLFEAIHRTQSAEVEILLFIGHKTKTSLPVDFPFLKVIKTRMLDRLHPLWLFRQFTLRFMVTDPALATILRRHRIDLLSHSGFIGGARQTKTLGWLFDFQFLHLPHHWQPRQLARVKSLYQNTCDQCDAVVVSSDDALADLQRFTNVRHSSTFVLKFVSNPIDFNAIPSRQIVIEKYRLPNDYFYLPNQFWMHKNHRLVIDALILLKTGGHSLTVVCTGRTSDLRNDDYFSDLMSHCTEQGLQDRFIVLGLVPYVDTQALMANCVAVINPSRFEGWSTTVEEAKAFGKRMLLSDLSVHREQAGDNGKYFGVDDAEALAGQLVRTEAESCAEYRSEDLQATHAVRRAEFGRNYLKIVEEVVGKNSAMP